MWPVVAVVQVVSLARVKGTLGRRRPPTWKETQAAPAHLTAAPTPVSSWGSSPGLAAQTRAEVSVYAIQLHSF